jgi:UDP-2,3-diacylglucosamine hydrolase
VYNVLIELILFSSPFPAALFYLCGMSTQKRIYFASDFHLGANARLTSAERERQIVDWLDQIAPTAEEIFLVGDLFDFWFEYRHAIPKGHIRFLGKLAELSDAGIPLHFFTGNHDMWIFRYFEEELGIPTYRQPIEREWQGKKFLIGHGDGLGPGDYGYKFLKKVFAHPLCQWAFARLHPNFGIGLAHFWSGKSRAVNPAEKHFLGPEEEWLLIYAEEQAKKAEYDFFVFGHRHLPIDYTLSNGRTRYINLGEWLNYNSYAVFDGENMALHFFENPQGVVFGNQ